MANLLHLHGRGLLLGLVLLAYLPHTLSAQSWSFADWNFTHSPYLRLQRYTNEQGSGVRIQYFPDFNARSGNDTVEDYLSSMSWYHPALGPVVALNDWQQPTVTQFGSTSSLWKITWDGQRFPHWRDYQRYRGEDNAQTNELASPSHPFSNYWNSWRFSNRLHYTQRTNSWSTNKPFHYAGAYTSAVQITGQADPSWSLHTQSVHAVYIRRSSRIRVHIPSNSLALWNQYYGERYNQDGSRKVIP